MTCLVVVGILPGALQALLRGFQLLGIASPAVVPAGWDILSGILAFYGLCLAGVPLLVTTFLRAIPAWWRVSLWLLFLLAVAGLVLFGQDLETAF